MFGLLLTGIIATILAILLLVCVVLSFASLAMTVIGLFRAAKLRRLEVSFLTAIASKNMLFHPELYQDEARRWAKWHLRGMVGVWLFVIASGIVMLLLRFIDP